MEITRIIMTKTDINVSHFLLFSVGQISKNSTQAIIGKVNSSMREGAMQKVLSDFLCLRS